MTPPERRPTDMTQPEAIRTLSARERLIVALDVADPQEALRLVEQLLPEVGLFKIGLQLYTATGPVLVRQVVERGARVFLDLKLHDIPNTVAGATAAACRLGVEMLTLHVSGGRAMMAAARQAADAAQAESGTRLRLLGVTVLTSLSQDDLAELGFHAGVQEVVLRLARQAQEAGLDGLVCSPREVAGLRRSGLENLFWVTPGIRPAGVPVDDQARSATAGEAVRAGASYLVVGRPILKAADPVAAARALVAEVEAAMI